MAEKTGAEAPGNMEATVKFRLSPDEKRRLAAAAEAAGMSLSAYIRTCLLDGPQRPVSVPREGEARARHVYLTDADWAALKYSAARAGYTASAYVRDRCVGQDPRYDGRLPTAALPSGEEMDRFRDCLAELLRQGNNWNQVARQINSARDPGAELKLLCEHLKALTRQSQEIHDRLENIFLAHKGK